MQAPNSVMAYEKEFFHLRWREKKREKLQGGASAAGGASTAGGSPAVGDWRWFPDSRRLALVSLLCKLRSVLIKSPEFIYGDAFLAAEF